MGVFTVFCAVCGGPACNYVGGWMRDYEEDGRLEAGSFLEPEETEWLGRQVVVHPTAVPGMVSVRNIAQGLLLLLLC